MPLRFEGVCLSVTPLGLVLCICTRAASRGSSLCTSHQLSASDAPYCLGCCTGSRPFPTTAPPTHPPHPTPDTTCSHHPRCSSRPTLYAGTSTTPAPQPTSLRLAPIVLSQPGAVPLSAFQISPEHPPIKHLSTKTPRPRIRSPTHLMKYPFGKGWVDVVAFKQLGDGLHSIPAAQDNTRVCQGGEPIRLQREMSWFQFLVCYCGCNMPTAVIVTRGCCFPLLCTVLTGAQPVSPPQKPQKFAADDPHQGSKPRQNKLEKGKPGFVLYCFSCGLCVCNMATATMLTSRHAQPCKACRSCLAPSRDCCS